jgi:hypothetical protein
MEDATISSSIKVRGGTSNGQGRGTENSDFWRNGNHRYKRSSFNFGT